MNHASLFSGIGSPELAAEWIGWENVFHCEINPFGSKILKYYWPKSDSYEDINKSDFSIYRGKIDILTGGFPCQPYSNAGKRLGKDDERHLWPEMLRVIRQVQPRWIVGENVRGIVSWNGGLVFEEVQSELEAEGYEVQPFVLPACAVNAPHRRDRVFFIAYSPSFGNTSSGKSGNIKKRGKDFIKAKRKRRSRGERTDGLAGFSRNVTDPHSEGLQRCKNIGGIREGGKKWEEQSLRFFCTKWEEFPTQSPICCGNDGLPSELDGITFPKWRNESIKAYGNSIVPQVMLQIFQAIKEYENLNS